MSAEPSSPPPPARPSKEEQIHVALHLEHEPHALSSPADYAEPGEVKAPRAFPSPSPSPKPATYSPFPPTRYRTPTPEPSGAAQFIANLSEKQRAHLQFAVPSKGDPERFSHFLEEPRKTPVPDRFTFEALDSEARTVRDLNSKVRRGDITKSGTSGKPPGSYKSTRGAGSTASSQHAREGSGATNSSGRWTPNSRSRSVATSFESMRKSIPRVRKEVRHFKGVTIEADWRFYATGICLALVNLVMAWDATAISIALPVRLAPHSLTSMADHGRRQLRWHCMGPPSRCFGWALPSS